MSDVTYLPRRSRICIPCRGASAATILKQIEAGGGHYTKDVERYLKTMRDIRYAPFSEDLIKNGNQKILNGVTYYLGHHRDGRQAVSVEFTCKAEL